MTLKTTQPRIHDHIFEWFYDDMLAGIAKTEEKAWLKVLGEVVDACGHEWEDRLSTAENDYTTAMTEGAFLLGIEVGRDPGRFLRQPAPSGGKGGRA